MGKLICPGQNTMFWKPEDIFEIDCPDCGKPVEFFKDDVARKCSECGRKIKNPRIDKGCLEWCQYASECMAEMGISPKGEKARENNNPEPDIT